MLEDRLTPEAKAVEAALSALAPVALGVSRDEMIYAAGLRAAQRRSQRWLPMWLIGFAVLLVGVSTLVGALVANGDAWSQPRTSVGSDVAATEPGPAPVEPQEVAVAPHADPDAAAQVDAAFSPIWNVNHWSVEELQKAGITVEPCSQWCEMFDPPIEWVTVRYDCSRLPADHDVVMFLQFTSSERDVETNSFKTHVSMRSIRGVPDKDSVSLEFAVSKDEYAALSNVTIMIWPPATESGRKAHGYTLSFPRMQELARARPRASGGL